MIDQAQRGIDAPSQLYPSGMSVRPISPGSFTASLYSVQSWSRSPERHARGWSLTAQPRSSRQVIGSFSGVCSVMFFTKAVTVFVAACFVR